MPRKVERTRNNGTWTEAAYFGAIRSGLRRTFRFWKPIMQAREDAKRPCKNSGRQKWEYKCAACGNYFKGSDVQVDHIVPVGSLRSLEDLPGFVERLTVEGRDAYRVLCKPCHQAITNEERKK